MIKECLDDSPIGVGVTDTLTNVSDTKDSLEEDNSLLMKCFEEPDSVIEEVMASATHVRDHKIVSADILSKI